MAKKTKYEIALILDGKINPGLVSAISSANSKLMSISSTAVKAAAGATAAFAGIAIGKYVTDSAEVYKEFNQQMADTAATIQATEEEYQKLEAAARKQGKATTKTASESAEALNYMGLAGWNVEKSMQGLPEILRFSEATGADLATTSDLVTDSMSAMQLEVEGLGRYMDIAAAANSKSNQTAVQLMEAYIGVGGTMAQLNVDVTDSATALGVLANRGKKGSEAGNSLNSIMLRLLSGTGEAGKAMKELGISAFDTDGQFIGLKETFEGINNALSDLTAEDRSAYLSALGGKSQSDTLNALLGGLNTEVADGVSEWDDLNQKLENSDGAMRRMADTVTNTLSASLDRLNSAMDDSKISFMDAFGDEAKDTVNAIAEAVPDLTQHINNLAQKSSGPLMDFLDNSIKKFREAQPEIILFTTKVGKGFERFWEITDPMFTFLKKNPTVVSSFLVSTIAAVKTHKVIENLTAVSGGFKALSTVLNPQALAFAASAAAITGLSVAIIDVRNRAKEANLQEHFGNLSLSIDELDAVAMHIVDNGGLLQLGTAMEALGNAEEFASKLKSVTKNIEKANWKISIGMELTEDEIEQYKNDIESFVNNINDYVTEQNYAVNLAVSVLVGDTLEGQNMISQITAFYTGKQDELTDMASELNSAMTSAFNDGILDINEVQAISRIQQQMANIQNQLAGADFDSEMQVLQMKFAGGELDAESFQNLQNAIAEKSEEAKQQYEEALKISLADVKIRFDDGQINVDEYEAQCETLKNNYLENIGDIDIKANDFILDTIVQQYGEELGGAVEQMRQITDEELGKILSSESVGSANDNMFLFENAATKITASLPEMESATRDAIHTLLENMKPSMEQQEQTRQTWIESGKVIPEGLEKGINDYEVMSAIAGNVDSLYSVMGSTIADSPEYTAAVEKMEANGTGIPETLASSLQSGVAQQQNKITKSASDFHKMVGTAYNNEFSKSIDVTAKINLHLATSATAKNGGIPGFADGGIISSAGGPVLAYFAEKYDESAIPLDGGSDRSISLWKQTGEMLGAFNRPKEIYKSLSSIETDSRNGSRSSQAPVGDIKYSPNIIINGNASREDINSAVDRGYEQFCSFMEQFRHDTARSSFSFGG